MLVMDYGRRLVVATDDDLTRYGRRLVLVADDNLFTFAVSY